MAEITSSPTELLAAGRRHLAVRDFSSAARVLAKACEFLAKKHGDTADQCATAYLWYRKALLGLSRKESGVLGDGMPGIGHYQLNYHCNGNDEDDEEENEEPEGNRENEQNGKNEAASSEVEKAEPESTTKEDEPGSSKVAADSGTGDEPGTTNGGVNDESEVKSEVNLENEDDVDNLQLAWEMLDLARSILVRRVEQSGAGGAVGAGGADGAGGAVGAGRAARSLLADVHLALGEVALERKTYDKAVLDMQSCLELQKELYRSGDRRIFETQYQIGLANSLASNLEDAYTNFKDAAIALDTRIKTLENPSTASEDATVKKFTATDPFYTIEGEIKELKELLPQIVEKIHDAWDRM